MSEETTDQLPGDGVRAIIARLDALGGRLASLEEKVDRRLQETRPIWEQVLSRLGGIEGRVEKIESRIEKIETTQDLFKNEFEEFCVEVRNSFRNQERRFNVIVEDMIALRADQKDLAFRVDKLESHQDG